MLRSLVLKIYLFAVLAIVLVFATNFWAGHVLMDRIRTDAYRATFRQIGTERAVYIAHEVARTLKEEPRVRPAYQPDPAELADLERGLSIHLRWVPWRSVGQYPIGLARSSVVFDDRDGHNPLRGYWVRIDHQGVPAGAMQVVSAFPRLPPLPRSISTAYSLVLAALTGLLLIPPLMLWVMRPLAKMLAVAHRLATGDLDTPVPQTRTDEFGDLERAFESLRLHTQQMIHSRDRLLADISHELRGPLSRMAIALPLLRSRCLEASTAEVSGTPNHSGSSWPQGPALRYVGQLEHEVGRMEALIEELLAFARGRSPAAIAQGPVDLAEVARTLVAERAIVARERGLTMHSECEPAIVSGDASLLARAMGNFLDNALKYTPGGGNVHLKTWSENGHCIVTVADDGPGIPAAAIEHLFEPFYRPDLARARETGGVGMGLAIARAIAERHGGKAHLESSEGKGTLARLELPAAQGIRRQAARG